MIAPQPHTGRISARQAGAPAPDAGVDPQLIVELPQPIVATAATSSFCFSAAGSASQQQVLP